MEKCKRKVCLSAMKRVPSFPSSTISFSSRILSVVLLVCLTVISSHVLVGAQNTEPRQQISVGDDEPPAVVAPHILKRHGGNLRTPQQEHSDHGQDNDIEFINEHTENFDPESPPPVSLPEETDFEPEEPVVGAGHTYLHNGVLEAGQTQHLDESLDGNQLPEDDDDDLADGGHRGSNGLFTELDGAVITGEKILRETESPYVLNTDLEIDRGGKLIIEPGVIIEFAPMVGITVRGVIIALVSVLSSFHIEHIYLLPWPRFDNLLGKVEVKQNGTRLSLPHRIISSHSSCLCLLY